MTLKKESYHRLYRMTKPIISDSYIDSKSQEVKEGSRHLTISDSYIDSDSQEVKEGSRHLTISDSCKDSES